MKEGDFPQVQELLVSLMQGDLGHQKEVLSLLGLWMASLFQIPTLSSLPLWGEGAHTSLVLRTQHLCFVATGTTLAAARFMTGCQCVLRPDKKHMFLTCCLLPVAQLCLPPSPGWCRLGSGPVSGRPRAVVSTIRKWSDWRDSSCLCEAERPRLG